MSQRARSFFDWIKIYALPLSVVLLGLAFSVASYYWLRTSRNKQIRRSFSALADSQLENFRGKISSYTSILQLVTDQFGSRRSISRIQFQSITSGIIKRHDEISSIQWLPFVPKNTVEKYLADLRAEGFDKQKILEVGPFRNNQSGTIDYYLPVTYIVPTLPGQKHRYIAVDYLSGRTIRPLLKRSATRNQVTSLLNLPSVRTLDSNQEKSAEKKVFVMLKPVYHGEHLMVVKRWQNLAGFIALQVPHRSAIESVFPTEKTTFIELYVFDNTDLLYSQQDSTGELSPQAVSTWWSYRRELPIGDKQLTFIINPTQSFIDERQTAYPWVVLILGLGLTGLSGWFTYSLSGEYLSREKQFYSVFDNAPYAIATLDQEGRIQLWNDSAESMFGYSTNEARGMRFFELLETEAQTPEDFLMEEDNDNTEGGDFREEIARFKTGSTFPINLGMRRWNLQGRTFYTVMVEDITERKEYERKIERMARRDNLTGLLNRGTFMEKLDEEFERVERYGQPLSVIMMDVDHFKQINDNHGHMIGDKVLKNIAEILENDTRKTDFVGRYGGEEFCVALPETDLKKARELAERLRRAIKEEEYDDGVSVSCSFGVAEHDGTLKHVDDLLNRADEALYQSKENGRDRTTVWQNNFNDALDDES